MALFFDQLIKTHIISKPKPTETNILISQYQTKIHTNMLIQIHMFVTKTKI